MQYNTSFLTKNKVVLSKLRVPDLLVECGPMIQVHITQIPSIPHGLLDLRMSR